MDDRSPETSYYSSARPSGATGSEAADNQKKSKTLPFALGVVQSGDYASQSEPNSPTHSHYLNSPDGDTSSNILPFSSVSSSSSASPSKSAKSQSSSKETNNKGASPDHKGPLHWISSALGSGAKKRKKNKKANVVSAGALRGINSSVAKGRDNGMIANPYAQFGMLGMMDSKRRSESVMEEDITLKTLPRRDRNSVIIRKSLAIDGQDGVLNTDNHSNNHMTQSPTSAAESSKNDSATGQKTLEVSGSSGIDGIGKRRERGKGHQFEVERDKNFPLWCDICGDAIISLLYQPLRCQHCGYLCHESCLPGVGLDCPFQLEKQLERDLLDRESTYRHHSQSEEPAGFLTGVSSSSSVVSEHSADSEAAAVSSLSSQPNSGAASVTKLDLPEMNSQGNDDSSPRSAEEEEQFYTIKDPAQFEASLRMNEENSQRKTKEENRTGGVEKLNGNEGRGVPPGREEQVQKWAKRLHRSNTLYSRASTIQRRSSTLNNRESTNIQSDILNDVENAKLVGSAAGPKLLHEERRDAGQKETSGKGFWSNYSTLQTEHSSSGGTVTSRNDSIISSTLPSKLKPKDLEKMILEYAKQNPHADIRIVKKVSKSKSRSKDFIISPSSNSNKKNKDKSTSADSDYQQQQGDPVEFEGFLHVTLCLHRPISVANEVALDFSLESVGKNMSFERSKSENRTTFYLPYGSEHAVRCHSGDCRRVVVSKLLQKFHVADDPRKYALFHDITSPSDPTVRRRKVGDDERPLLMVLLLNRGGGGASEEKHSFVLEENEQPDIQWDCFSEHELEMFLDILRIEEEQHMAMIKEKYQEQKRQLQEKLTLLTNYLEATKDDSMCTTDSSDATTQDYTSDDVIAHDYANDGVITNDYAKYKIHADDTNQSPNSADYMSANTTLASCTISDSSA